MRELKFRIMYKKYPSSKGSRSFIKKEYTLKDLIEMDGNGFLDDDDIIEQYTGLKDKNGKEIYDGDIIEYDWYIVGDKPAYRVKKQVILDDLGARVGDDRIRYCTNVEVIGNIHENPELVGDNKE